MGDTYLYAYNQKRSQISLSSPAKGTELKH